MQVDDLVNASFDLPVVQALIGAFESGYAQRAQIVEAFADPRLATVPAGHFRNRKIDDALLSGLERRLPNVTVSLLQIPRSPNKLALVRLGTFALVPGAIPRVPRRKRIPRSSQTRLRLAQDSMVEPIQPRLPQFAVKESARAMDGPLVAGDYVFGILAHEEDPEDRSKLGTLDLVIVDQGYRPILPIDLLSRRTVLLEALQPVVLERARVRRRGTQDS